MTRIEFRPATRPLQALLLSASALAIASPASAAQKIFPKDVDLEVEIGERISQASGLTQIRLDSGAMLSFVNSADYRINADGSLDLYAGSVTVAGAVGGVTVIRMPDGIEGRVGGGAASFSVTDDGTSRGHALTGDVTIVRAGNARTFAAGEMWAANDERLRQVVSNGAQAAPGEEEGIQVADMRQGGPVAAAENGLPVALGDALAAAGASGDVLAAARRVEAAAGNPDLATFPTGDLALLVSYSAQLQNAYRAPVFAGAQADVIRAYLGFLANGGSGGDFLSAYGTFLGQYLDLIRAGALPSSFEGASVADLDAFIGYTARTSGFGALSARNRELVEAYLAFLSGGGQADLFARSYTDLVETYFAYLREGGDPLAFAGASQQTLSAYIAFLADSGLAEHLSEADRALLTSYLANGGLAFADQYRTALGTYFDYLAAGNLPSGYAALDEATLRAYLEALESTGLLSEILGAQASFYSALLAHLEAGGALDAFAGLNANVFAGYADQLDTYYGFLLQGGEPSDYAGLTQQQIADYVAALQAAGASTAFLDDLAEFYTGYAAYLAGGGNPDIYAGLPVLNLPGFADALNAYAAFLAGGGLPSAYAAADVETLAQYIDALARSGQLAALLGANADLLNAYFDHFADGGSADSFAGLPIYAGYVSALQAYYAYLEAGGLPANYAGLTAQQIQTYLAGLAAAGGLQAQLGDLSTFFNEYYAFVSAGGSPGAYSGLPVYAGYVAALNAYYAFLADGGLPGDYTALTAEQIEGYLAALHAAGGFDAYGTLSSFFADYYAFVAAGGDPAEFAGIPVYADYLAALEAYYIYLAGGGLPSGYTVLTQSQIRAYLEALDGAGVLTAELTGEQLAFVLDYLAYIQTGAEPDDFAGLPVNDPAVTLLAGADAWIFSNEGGQMAVATTADVEADGQIVSAALQLSAQSVVTFDYSGAENTLREHGRAGGNVAWTRYERGAGVGVTNSNVHFLLGTPAIDLPASGTVDYRLIGGTAPTNAMAPAGEIGAFTGDLAVAFGATPRVGLEFDVHVGTRGWHAETSGGAAGAATGGLVVGGDMRFQNLDLSHSGIAGNACSGYCVVQVYGGLFGDGAANAGFQYHIDDQSSGGRSYVNGVAVFGTIGTELARIGEMPSTPPPPPSVEHPANLAYAGGFDTSAPATVIAHFRGYSGADDKAITLDADGTLLSAADDFYTPTGGDSVDVQGDTLGILGRFTGGDLTLFTSRQFNAIAANTGAHWVVLAAPTGTMPVSGTIEYDLLAATHPTFTNAVTAPGSFDGELTLTFGSSSIDGSIAGRILMTEGSTDHLYSFDYDFSTTAVTLAQGLYLYDYQGLDGTGLACPTAGDCSVNISLAAGGSNGADRAGMTYETFGGSLSAPRITGAALFGAPGTWPAAGDSGGSGGSGGETTSDFTGTRTGQVYYTYTNGSLALGFGGSATLADGKITGVSSVLGDTTTTGQVVEAGDLGDMAWARWTGGEVVTTGILGSTVSVGANGGYHVMAGTPVTSLPTSGTVDYELVATTSATDNLGSAPGTVSGDLAIAFGSVGKVGYDLEMEVGGRSWAVATTGGAANPSASTVTLNTGSAGATFTGVHTSTSNMVTAGGSACQASCVVNVGGSLYGANGGHAGVAMNVLDTSVTATVQASGLAIFSTEGATPTGSADWSRFAGDRSIEVAPVPSAQLGAIGPNEAAGLLGGNITFAGQ